MSGRCARRDEVRAMLALGHWPEGCAVELREHVEGCVECCGVAEMTRAMQQARGSVVPRLPSAELVWWRAQLRKRQAALQQVRRPMRGAQMFAVGLSLCAAAGLLGWQLMRGEGGGAMDVVDGRPLLLAGAGVILVAGLVVYLAVAME